MCTPRSVGHDAGQRFWHRTLRYGVATAICDGCAHPLRAAIPTVAVRHHNSVVVKLGVAQLRMAGVSRLTSPFSVWRRLTCVSALSASVAHVS